MICSIPLQISLNFLILGVFVVVVGGGGGSFDVLFAGEGVGVTGKWFRNVDARFSIGMLFQIRNVCLWFSILLSPEMHLFLKVFFFKPLQENARFAKLSLKVPNLSILNLTSIWNIHCTVWYIKIIRFCSTNNNF